MDLVKWARVCGVASFAMACSTTQPGNGVSACLKGAGVGLAAGVVSGGVATALQRDDRETFAITAAASSVVMAGIGCYVFSKRSRLAAASVDDPATAVVKNDDGVQVINPIPEQIAAESAPNAVLADAAVAEAVDQAAGDSFAADTLGMFDAASISQLGPVQFTFASASLDSDAVSVISSLADQMNAAENANQLLVIGHTCAHGSDDYNLRLAQQRADAVKSVLINSYGIPSSRIVTEALGEASPLTGVDEFDPRNRRVELQVRSQEFVQRQGDE